jgi:hypothetical protein
MPRSRSRSPHRKIRNRSRSRSDSNDKKYITKNDYYNKRKYEYKKRNHHDVKRYDLEETSKRREKRGCSNERKRGNLPETNNSKIPVCKDSNNDTEEIVTKNIQRIREAADTYSKSENEEIIRKSHFDLSDDYRKSFEKFSNEHQIDLTSMNSEEDRIAVQQKIQEHLKRVFAAQGKVYPPPPKTEKPLINAATGFANDGSFLEQFKKMQQEQQMKLEEEKKRLEHAERLKNLPVRRRGGKILKTGIVAKNKLCDDNQETPVDAWNLYLKEVQKYKNASCDADSKTRPLVK